MPPASPLQPSIFDQIYVDEADQAEPAERERTAQQQKAAIDNLGLSAQNQRAAELLAILTGLSQGQAAAVLKKAGGALELARLPEQAVASLPNIGPKRAKQIKAMTDWALLIRAPDYNERMHIRSPADAANLLMLEMSLLEREQLRVIGLDTKNNVCFVETTYSGSLNTTVVRVAEVLRMAVIMNCASIILAHNHPSGDVAPSPEDVRVTELIREAAEKFDITVLDHLVIGKNRYLSLKEKGLGFP